MQSGLVSREGLSVLEQQSYQYYQGGEIHFLPSDFMYKKGSKVPSSNTRSRKIL